MKTKQAFFQENNQKEFASARRKIFWRGVRTESLRVATTAFLIGLVVIIIISLKNGGLSPMTDHDIAVFIELELEYSIPFWWNLLFGVIWALMIYWMLMSHWLKTEMGRMRNPLVGIVIIGGLYFSIAYGGMLYGLIVSAAFFAVVILILLVSKISLDSFFSI